MSEAVEQSDHDTEKKTVRLGPRSITIPEDWDSVAFEEAIELNPKYAKPGEGPFDYLPMDAVDEGKQTIEYWTKREKDDCTTTWFKNEDTVYAKITPCTENGKIAFIEGMSTEVGSGSTEFLVFHPQEGVTDERFVYYLSNLPDFRAVTISLMEGSTGRQRVPSDVFKKGIEVPLPPLAQQRRIAGILSTVDEQIQRTDEIIKEAKELKKGLMQDLLHRGIGHDEFKEMYIGPKRSTLPVDWDVVQLGEIADIQSGATPKRSNDEYWDNGTIPWIKSGEFNDRVVAETEEYITEQALEETGCVVFPEGTLLIALYGKGTVSKTARLGIDAATNQAIAGLLPESGAFNPRYLQYYLIDSRDTLLNVTVNPSSDTGRTNIYMSALRQFKVALPPLEEQEAIADRIAAVEDKISDEVGYKQHLQKLKRGLMQDLLTGKVRVNTD